MVPRGLLFGSDFETLFYCGCFEDGPVVICVVTEGSRVIVDVGAGMHLNT
jgi:hypothetical protein